jgi:hypothetical protein
MCQSLRKLCDDNSDWELVFGKKNICIWTRLLDGSPFHMIKAFTEFKDVPANVCYDVLQASKDELVAKII